MPRGVYERKPKTKANNLTKGKRGYFLDPNTHRQKSKKKWPELWQKVKNKEVEVIVALPHVENVIPPTKHHQSVDVRMLLVHGERALMKDVKEGKITELTYDRCCAIMALRILEGKAI